MRERHISGMSCTGANFHGMSCTDPNFQEKIIFLNWERFEPTNHFISRLSKIVRVNAVMNRTVVDSDWRFHNLSGSHLQKTLKLTTAQVVETSVTVNNSPIQDHVHLDDHAQPTYEYRLWVFLKLFRAITKLSRVGRTENAKIWKGSCGPPMFIQGNYQVHMRR